MISTLLDFTDCTKTGIVKLICCCCALRANFRYCPAEMSLYIYVERKELDKKGEGNKKTTPPTNRWSDEKTFQTKKEGKEIGSLLYQCLHALESFEIRMYVCMYRGRPLLRGGTHRDRGSNIPTHGIIDTASLTLDHTCTLVYVFWASFNLGS